MVFFALAGGWHWVLTWDRCSGANARLIVITCIVRVIVMCLVLMFFCLELDVCFSWGFCSTPRRCACSSAHALSMAWMPCCRNCKGSCSPISFCIFRSYYNTRCHCNPATCSHGDSTCCLTCCGNPHLRDIVPSHGGPSHHTAFAVRDASCVSCIARSDTCIILPGSHLLPANQKCSSSTLQQTGVSCH